MSRVTGGLEVNLPSGEVLEVMIEAEADWVADRTESYLTELGFSTSIDLTALDRLVVAELLYHRYSTWVVRGKNYVDGKVVAEDWREFLIKYSQEIRQCQKMLGIDKVARDKAKGEGSVAAFIYTLTVRASRFGVMRSRQMERSITSFMELRTMIEWYFNATPEERAHFKLDAEGILQWVQEKLGPEFDQIDADYREGDQRLWVGTN